MRKFDLNLSIFFILFGLSTALCAGLAARAYWFKPSDHLGVRTAVIADQLRQATDRKERFSVLVGDSLVERLYLDQLCGERLINAGISRARVSELDEVGRIARASGASLRVLSIGVNDVSRGTDPKRFTEDYSNLVGIYEPDVVVGITGSRREPYNSIIRKVAAHAVYVEPLGNEFLQPDGIHYTARGAAVLAGRIEQACSVAVARRDGVSPQRAADAHPRPPAPAASPPGNPARHG